LADSAAPLPPARQIRSTTLVARWRCSAALHCIACSEGPRVGQIASDALLLHVVGAAPTAGGTNMRRCVSGPRRAARRARVRAACVSTLSSPLPPDRSVTQSRTRARVLSRGTPGRRVTLGAGPPRLSYHTLPRYSLEEPVRRGLEPLDLAQDRESGGRGREQQRVLQRPGQVRGHQLYIWVAVRKTWSGRKTIRR